VSGPLVEVEGAPGASMLEVMAVGEQRISAEAVSIHGDRVTLQAYEYTGGLQVGDPVLPTGEPLSGLLGPGLLGHVFDGLMRPLSSAPQWLTRDRPPVTRDPAVLGREWTFVPAVAPGARVGPGSVVGTVPGAGTVEHRVMIPWGVCGETTWVSPQATVHALDVVARVGEHEVRLAETWPIRRPRPFRERLTEAVPLHTGQRVMDLLYP
jgi:V/A-type H+-transporting ATPase subunit A